ncbi:MAG: heparinase II/III family protein [Candidatus Didemnitutus sp.]|nr:heparinase II/III family protein [Candidatus Didemnitutus sp.]
MNYPTRRTFLKTSATLAAALPLLRIPLGAADSPAPAGASPGAARGLLFDAADLPRMRANLELPRFAAVRAMLFEVDFAAETKFLREELRLNNHVADFMRGWKLIQNNAFAYALTGSEQHRDLALLAMRRLCDYKRWDYFLEGGKDTIGLQRAPESTIATCYALEWLGDAVPADLLAAVEDKIVNEGAPACYRTLYGMKYPDRVRGWGFDPEDDYGFRFDLSRWPLILNATNLKVIPICGLGLAAIRFHGRHPEAAKWMELARQSAQAFSVMYGQDGSYDEGVGYWGYTTMHLAMFADALHRRLGIDDRGLINYPGTVRYALAMSMPCGGDKIEDPMLNAAYNAVPKGSYDPGDDIVNFCDGSAGMDVSIAPWVGRVANDPLSNHVAKHTGALKHLQAVAWFHDDAPTQAPTAALHDVRLSNDWVISRTGWTPADTVVAFRSGGPANHEHADRNSVIFKAHGDRLFHDPFKAGYSPTGPRWLLRQTEAHTAVLINGKGHQYHDGREGTNASWASARVTDFRTGPSWMMVTSDATEAYALVLPDVVHVSRTVVLLKPDVLLLLDRVQLKQAAPVQARFQVFNEDGRGLASAGAAGFRIERPLATLQARLAGRGELTASVGQLSLPVEEGVFPYAEVSSAAATEHTILTVSTSAPRGSDHGNLEVQTIEQGWIITGRHRSQNVRVTLTAVAGELPQLML